MTIRAIIASLKILLLAMVLSIASTASADPFHDHGALALQDGAAESAIGDTAHADDECCDGVICHSGGMMVLRIAKQMTSAGLPASGLPGDILFGGTIPARDPPVPIA